MNHIEKKLNENERDNVTPEHMPDAGNWNILKNSSLIIIPISNMKEKVFYLSMERQLSQQNNENEDLPKEASQSEDHIQLLFQMVHPNVTQFQLKEFLTIKKQCFEKRKDYLRFSVLVYLCNMDCYIHFDIRNEWIAVMITHKNCFQREPFRILNELHLEYQKFHLKMNELVHFE